MKTATQNLENDHFQILRLIKVMGQVTKSTEYNVEHLELIVKVIREFADAFHHAKEETLLFPLMVQKGFSIESGPVAVMLHDHKEGRDYVKGMIENITRLKRGEADALKVIYNNMNGYAVLLTDHIGKENNVLFRMADKVFSNADQESLLDAFSKVEGSQPEGMRAVDYVSIIDSLEAAYSR